MTLSQDLEFHPLGESMELLFLQRNGSKSESMGGVLASLGFVTWTQTSLMCQEGSLNSAASPDTRFYLLSVFAASILRSWSRQQHYYKKCTGLGHECLELLRHKASIIFCVPNY